MDQTRRELIRTLAKGGVYAAPVIVSMAAPVRLMAQGPSGMMSFCDYFPILCMWFGGAPSGARTSTPSAQPTTAPGASPAPWTAPAPGATPPPTPPPPGRSR
jgi:hypothetical protein